MDERQTEEIVRRSIRIQPGFAAAQALLGKILLQQNKTDEAIQVLEKAVPLRPEYTATHLYLSQAYRKVGRMEDAERELKTLRELNDRKPPTPMLNYRKVPRAAAHQ
jgi:predicted Zn-dependent protease